MFNTSNRSVPEGDLIWHLKRDEVGKMKQLEKLPQLLRALTIRPGLMIALTIEDDEVIGNIPQRTQTNDPQHRIREETLIHHEVDDLDCHFLIREEGDRISVLIVRQEQPPRGPDELRYAQPVAVLDVPRLHEGLLREQPFHTSVG